eukprot:Nitzschia sp. Nitz4//scaffold28_size193895//175697//176548//NITZ4_001689-RA/size193895-processed-gene-0.284-mRNA-1//-1//CDS//3329546054//4928//frame0
MTSAMDTLQVLLNQEESAYQVRDYLSVVPKLPQHMEPAVDAECRRVMAKWCNDIAEFCNYSRETISIAMNCLDRFMATPDGCKILLDRNHFQLASMTALYTAVKIHEHEAMDPALVSTLSRGVHTAQAVEYMEQRMLQAIGWRVNPPTPGAFATNMLALVSPRALSDAEKEIILELASCQVHMATCSYDFVTVPPSHVALASILNAMGDLLPQNGFCEQFASGIASTLGAELNNIRDLRISLYEAVEGCEPMEIAVTHCNAKEVESHSNSSGEYEVSPRAVNA